VVSFRSPVTTAVRDAVLGFVTSLSIVGERVQRSMSMLGVAYADSPICGQDRTPLWGTRILGDGEAPTALDWAAFGDGPAPGERAYPLPALKEPRHVALLFDGGAATQAGYDNLADIARKIAARTSEIAVHVVVPGDKRPAALAWNGSVLLDAGGAIHKRFGARSECLYLIRPDGYVAYRNQPADGAKLLAYLDRIFT